jgi:hypothetical protein
VDNGPSRGPSGPCPFRDEVVGIGSVSVMPGRLQSYIYRLDSFHLGVRSPDVDLNAHPSMVEQKITSRNALLVPPTRLIVSPDLCFSDF